MHQCIEQQKMALDDHALRQGENIGVIGGRGEVVVHGGVAKGPFEIDVHEQRLFALAFLGPHSHDGAHAKSAKFNHVAPFSTSAWDSGRLMRISRPSGPSERRKRRSMSAMDAGAVSTFLDHTR